MSFVRIMNMRDETERANGKIVGAHFIRILRVSPEHMILFYMCEIFQILKGENVRTDRFGFSFSGFIIATIMRVTMMESSIA